MERRLVEHYLPTFFEAHRSKCRHKTTVERILFPGYIFAHIDPMERLRVLGVNGVVSILGFSGRMEAIPDSQISGVRALVDSGLPCAHASVEDLHAGDPVRVVFGPLAGVEGRLTRVKAHHRLVISVELLGRGVSTEVEIEDVEPIRRPSKERFMGGVITTTSSHRQTVTI